MIPPSFLPKDARVLPVGPTEKEVEYKQDVESGFVVTGRCYCGDVVFGVNDKGT